MRENDAVSYWLRRKMIERCDAVQRWFDEHYEEIPRSPFGKLLVKLRLLKKYREIEPPSTPVKTIRVLRYPKMKLSGESNGAGGTSTACESEHLSR